MVSFDNYDEVTNVDAWLEDYASNPNLLWVTDHQHVVNVVNELILRSKDAYQQGRDDAARDVREEKNLPEEVFPAGGLTTRFVLSVIEKCAERAEGISSTLEGKEEDHDV